MEESLFINALRVGLVVIALGSLTVFFLRQAWAERPASMLPQDIDGANHQAPPSLSLSDDPKAASLWAITLLLSLVYIVSGIPKLGGVSYAIHQFEQWGYPDWFRQMIGGVELFSAIMLLIPTAAFWAACVLGIIMIGSVYTHLAAGQWAMAFIPVVFLAALSYVAIERRPAWLGGES